MCEIGVIIFLRHPLHLSELSLCMYPLTQRQGDVMNCGKDFFVGKECHTRLWNGGNLTPSRQESHSVSIGRYGSNFDQFQLLCSFQRITKELLNFSQVSLEGGRVFMKQELVLKLPMQHCVRSARQNLPFDNETVLDL